MFSLIMNMPFTNLPCICHNTLTLSRREGLNDPAMRVNLQRRDIKVATEQSVISFKQIPENKILTFIPAPLKSKLLTVVLWGLLLSAISSSLSSAVARQFDLLVYGATPGGVALATRAAREGLNVQLVSHTDHLGGLLSNGLSTMDTLYNGARSPLYDELRKGIYDYYLQKYGLNSPQYKATQPGHPKTRYEAHVVEGLINDLLRKESRILLVTGYYPVAAERESTELKSVTFQEIDGGNTLTVQANVFADCSYEADLAKVAGVPYRVGREARNEFKEKHGGVVYVRLEAWPPANVDAEAWAIARNLNLYRYEEWFEIIPELSTGAANASVQGYNMRTIITRDPSNRIPIQKPENYDPEFLRTYGFGNPASPGLSMPNQKFGMNEPKLIGKQDPYVEGDWEARRRVTEVHSEATLALLYFRQHDPSVPESIRQEWLQYGLPRDEFSNNGHMPYEIYARETRRIRGLSVFSENDAQLASGLERAPVHPDSISITEWFLDSHACTPRQISDSEMEGKVMMKNQTFPGQVSFRTILPEGYKNLVVPVCLSSTHVGWGTIRLEPTWMSIAEAAAYAVVIAKKAGLSVPEINPDTLVRLLAEHHFLLSFFNDVEGYEEADWFPAIQYLGTKGFFGTYYARPSAFLTDSLATAWINLAARMVQGASIDATSAARLNLTAEKKESEALTAFDFVHRLANALPKSDWRISLIPTLLDQYGIDPNTPISRGDACRLIFQITAKN